MPAVRINMLKLKDALRLKFEPSHSFDAFTFTFRVLCSLFFAFFALLHFCVGNFCPGAQFHSNAARLRHITF